MAEPATCIAKGSDAECLEHDEVMSYQEQPRLSSKRKAEESLHVACQKIRKYAEIETGTVHESLCGHRELMEGNDITTSATSEFQSTSKPDGALCGHTSHQGETKHLSDPKSEPKYEWFPDGHHLLGETFSTCKDDQSLQGKVVMWGRPSSDHSFKSSIFQVFLYDLDGSVKMKEIWNEIKVHMYLHPHQNKSLQDELQSEDKVRRSIRLGEFVTTPKEIKSVPGSTISFEAPPEPPRSNEVQSPELLDLQLWYYPGDLYIRNVYIAPWVVNILHFLRQNGTSLLLSILSKFRNGFSEKGSERKNESFFRDKWGQGVGLQTLKSKYLESVACYAIFNPNASRSSEGRPSSLMDLNGVSDFKITYIRNKDKIFENAFFAAKLGSLDLRVKLRVCSYCGSCFSGRFENGFGWKKITSKTKAGNFDWKQLMGYDCQACVCVGGPLIS